MNSFVGGALLPGNALVKIQVRKPYARLVVTDTSVAIERRLGRRGELRKFDLAQLEYVEVHSIQGDWLGLRQISGEFWSWFTPREPIADLVAVLQRTRATAVSAARVDFPTPEHFTLAGSIAFVVIGLAAVLLTTADPMLFDHVMARFRGPDQAYNAGSFAIKLAGGAAIVMGIAMGASVVYARVRSRLRTRRA